MKLSKITEALMEGALGAAGGQIYGAISGNEVSVEDQIRNALKRIKNIVTDAMIQNEKSKIEALFTSMEQYSNDNYGRGGIFLDNLLQRSNEYTASMYNFGYKVTDTYLFAAGMQISILGLRYRRLKTALTAQEKEKKRLKVSIGRNKKELLSFERDMKEVEVDLHKDNISQELKATLKTRKITLKGVISQCKTEENRLSKEYSAVEKQLETLKGPAKKDRLQKTVGSVAGAGKNVGLAAKAVIEGLLKHEKKMRKELNYSFYEYGGFKRFMTFGERCDKQIFDSERNPEQWFGERYADTLKSLLKLVSRFNPGKGDFDGHSFYRQKYMPKFYFGTNHDHIKKLWSANEIDADEDATFYKCFNDREGYYPIGDKIATSSGPNGPMIYLRHRKLGAYLHPDARYNREVDMVWDNGGSDNSDKSRISHMRFRNTNKYQTLGDAAVNARGGRHPQMNATFKDIFMFNDNYGDSIQDLVHQSVRPYFRWKDAGSGANLSTNVMSRDTTKQGKIRISGAFQSVCWDRDDGKFSKELKPAHVNLERLDGIWIDIGFPGPLYNKHKGWRSPKDVLPS